MNNAPIGIFDSGLGGLTVARAIIDQLPNEPITYIGDTANTPYGPKPLAQVRELALNVMDELVDSGVKMLVIACNSASAAVLRDARERYTRGFGIPVIEVIQPAVRSAVQTTRNGKVGVIGTEATISSRAYEDSFAAAPNLELTMAACPRFVEFVEAGITSGDELLEVAREYLTPIKSAGADTLVLGCTHYPLLTGVISYVMGDAVNLVSSAEETAKDVYRSLAENNAFAQNTLDFTENSTENSSGEIRNNSELNRELEVIPRRQFFATGDEVEFAKLARRFLGPEVAGVQKITPKHLEKESKL